MSHREGTNFPVFLPISGARDIGNVICEPSNDLYWRSNNLQGQGRLIRGQGMTLAKKRITGR